MCWICLWCARRGLAWGVDSFCRISFGWDRGVCWDEFWGFCGLVWVFFLGGVEFTSYSFEKSFDGDSSILKVFPTACGAFGRFTEFLQPPCHSDQNLGNTIHA